MTSSGILQVNVGFARDSVCLYTLGLDSATSVPCSALFMTFVHLSSDESESKRFISLFRSSVSPQPLGNKNQRTVGKINQQLYLIALLLQLLLSSLLGSLHPSVSGQRKANGQFYSAILPRSPSQYWNWHTGGIVRCRWRELSRIFRRSGPAINIHHIPIYRYHLNIWESNPLPILSHVSKIRIFRSSSTLINCWCHFNQKHQAKSPQLKVKV